METEELFEKVKSFLGTDNKKIYSKILFECCEGVMEQHPKESNELVTLMTIIDYISIINRMQGAKEALAEYTDITEAFITYRGKKHVIKIPR
jgi:hypothetical protein